MHRHQNTVSQIQYPKNKEGVPYILSHAGSMPYILPHAGFEQTPAMRDGEDRNLNKASLI